MNNPIFSWQKAAWQQLHQLRQRLPHALLFYGPQGVGKTVFAERFAQSLLCEKPDAEGFACGQCASCGWVEQYSHPDYRRVRPETLDADESDAEGAEANENAEEGKKAAKSSKAPSKDIRIDQVRALTDFMNISTHRRGMRVVVLYPAEALNNAAANALLKMLEEPPPGTVFLLVCNGLERLLPTILSRCRKFALPLPPHHEALAWLEAQQVADAESWLAVQGGAPLAAQAASQTGMREVMEDFLAQLMRPGTEGALKTADRLQKVPLTELVAWLQRWLYDIFSVKLCGVIRYYPRYRKELTALAQKVDNEALLAALKSAGERRMIAEHPLSPKLFIEDMLLHYSMLF